MITRYFSPSPRVTGPLAFLAGFGQQRQQVKAAEAGMDFQQGQALSQGIAGAGQGIAQGLSQRAQQVARANLLQQRLQEGRYEDAAEAYRKVGGVPGQPPPGIDFGPAAVGAPPAIGPQRHGAGVLEGPPAPGEPQPIELAAPFAPQQPPEPGGVPMPVIDPSTVGKYRELQEKVRVYDNYSAMLKADGFMPEEEKARKLARIAQVVAPMQAFLDKHPEPKPPRTYEELAAAGPSAGGFTAIPGTYNYAIPDGKGGVKVSTAVHPKEDMGWMTIPDPVKRSEAKRAHLENHRVMLDDEEYLWDGKQWDKQTPDRDEFDLGDFVEKGIAKAIQEKGKVPDAVEVDQIIQAGLKASAAIDLRKRQIQQRKELESAGSPVQVLEILGKSNPAIQRSLTLLEQANRTRFQWPRSTVALKAAGTTVVTALTEMDRTGMPLELQLEIAAMIEEITSTVEQHRKYRVRGGP